MTKNAIKSMIAALLLIMVGTQAMSQESGVISLELKAPGHKIQNFGAGGYTLDHLQSLNWHDALEKLYGQDVALWRNIRAIIDSTYTTRTELDISQLANQLVLSLDTMNLPEKPKPDNCDDCNYSFSIERDNCGRIVGAESDVKEALITIAEAVKDDSCCNDCEKNTNDSTKQISGEPVDQLKVEKPEKVDSNQTTNISDPTKFRRFGLMASYAFESETTFTGLTYRIPITSNKKLIVYAGGVLGRTISDRHDVTFDPTSLGQVDTRRHSFLGGLIGTQYDFWKKFTVGTYAMAWSFQSDDIAAGPYVGYRNNQGFQVDIAYLAGKDVKGINLNFKYNF
jgi:hypothetical protein